MYDVIVIGARCAGSPTAMLLARKGYSVLLVDRSTFPSNTIKNHFIREKGVAKLAQWDLLSKLQASNCPGVRKQTVDMGDFPLTGYLPATYTVDAMYGPRRFVLDKILVDAAIEAGVEMREGFSVSEILTEDDRVIGIRGKSSNGAIVSEYAPIVVGADGQHSIVARTMRAPTYNERPRLTCGYYSYWSGMDCDGIEVYIRDRPAMMLAFPTNNDLTCVAVQVPVDEFDMFRTNIETNFLLTIELAPDLAQRVYVGRREERFLGTADLSNFFRKPYGLGWALVGDAGYHKDPITALGISDAFRDAELLANALDDNFSGRQSFEEALAGYERTRNEIAMPMYEETLAMAAFTPVPERFLRLRAMVRGNQSATDSLIFGSSTRSSGQG